MIGRFFIPPPPGSLGIVEVEEALCPAHCMAMALTEIIITFDPRVLLHARRRFAFERQRLHYQVYTPTAVGSGLIHTIHRCFCEPFITTAGAILRRTRDAGP